MTFLSVREAGTRSARAAAPGTKLETCIALDVGRYNKESIVRRDRFFARRASALPLAIMGTAMAMGARVSRFAHSPFPPADDVNVRKREKQDTWLTLRELGEKEEPLGPSAPPSVAINAVGLTFSLFRACLRIRHVTHEMRNRPCARLSRECVQCVRNNRRRQRCGATTKHRCKNLHRMLTESHVSLSRRDDAMHSQRRGVSVVMYSSGCSEINSVQLRIGTWRYRRSGCLPRACVLQLTTRETTWRRKPPLSPE